MKPSFLIRLFLMGVCAVALAEKGFGAKIIPIEQEEKEQINPEQLRHVQTVLKEAFHGKNKKIGKTEQELGTELLSAFSETLLENKGKEALLSRAESILMDKGLASNEGLKRAYLHELERCIKSVKHPIWERVKEPFGRHTLTTSRLASLYVREILKGDQGTSEETFCSHAKKALTQKTDKRLRETFFNALEYAANPRLGSKTLKEDRNRLIKFIVAHADETTRDALLAQIAANWKIVENQDLEKGLQKLVGQALAKRR